MSGILPKRMSTRFIIKRIKILLISTGRNILETYFKIFLKFQRVVKNIFSSVILDITVAIRIKKKKMIITGNILNRDLIYKFSIV